ncbi:XRE family transcriptional regulator [Flavobacterium cupreum]|uniref:XRE family transcriptional regulator n=1 Tax=Flavobacterium cupreum TaxID=2133766 RepID=A0A434A6S8_9FLAO|nr:helix-turn-helix transcriptional regulator [Flavobacterium cupreum]RUT70032.1 XRE family transcriptional regulator [Flavobacterium cupreum]
MYNVKLARFFKAKGLKQKEVGLIMGFSEAMVGRYLNRTAKMSPEFLMSLSRNFPEVDLNDLFAADNGDPNTLNEPHEKYHTTVLSDIGEIEARLQIIKKKLSQSKD